MNTKSDKNQWTAFGVATLIGVVGIACGIQMSTKRDDEISALKARNQKLEKMVDLYEKGLAKIERNTSSAIQVSERFGEKLEELKRQQNAEAVERMQSLLKQIEDKHAFAAP